MLRDKGGNVIYNVVELKIFGIGNRGHKVNKIKAPKNKGFNEEAIHTILMDNAEAIEKQLPDEEYGCVEVGPARYNFVWRRSKVAAPVQ